MAEGGGFEPRKRCRLSGFQVQGPVSAADRQRPSRSHILRALSALAEPKPGGSELDVRWEIRGEEAFRQEPGTGRDSQLPVVRLRLAERAPSRENGVGLSRVRSCAPRGQTSCQRSTASGVVSFRKPMTKRRVADHAVTTVGLGGAPDDVIRVERDRYIWRVAGLPKGLVPTIGRISGTLNGMSTVEKVTISLPSELLARIEIRRRGTDASRSEVMSDLLWRGWRQAETEAREQRYRASYQADPETKGEQGWAEQAAADMLGGEHFDWGADGASNNASS